MKYSEDGKTIEGANVAYHGAYLNGYLPTRGKTDFCLRSTAGPGRNDLHGVLLGMAAEGVNLDIYTDVRSFMIYLSNGDRYGITNGGKCCGILSGASPGDTIRVLYDADANTLTYYRNGHPYSNPIPLTANLLNEKSTLRFYVMLLFSGQYSALV